MDVLLYYFSNILATVAAVLLLKVHAFGQVESKNKSLLISRDLEVLLAVSSLARAYWSFSPPPVWNSDPVWIQVRVEFVWLWAMARGAVLVSEVLM